MLIIVRNLVCLVGLVFLIPVILLFSILILIEDGFPIIFKQHRVGLKKKQFVIFKLRTIKNETPSLGTHDVENGFILKTGNIIRKLKIDELPQLYNVIRGDLDLIGYRPGLMNQITLNNERYKKNIFQNKPGITGLAQVTGFDMSNPDLLAKIDKIYYEHKSLKLDFLILLCTLTGLFRDSLKNIIDLSLDNV